MPRRKGLRPRVLSVAFGVMFLIMAVIAYWFATGPGSTYRYGADTTRFALAGYLFAGAAILAGVGIVAVGQMRSLDRRIEEAEDAGGVETIVEEVVTMEEEPRPEPDPESEDLPPPLEEAPAPADHVDQDIDELLVSLEEIETVTQEAPAEAAEAEPASEPTTTRRVFSETRRRPSAQLETLVRRRETVPAFFAGPALASVGVVAIAAAMLPGADAMLQSTSYYQLDTALLLGLGYSLGLVALYAVLAILGIMRSK